MRGFVVRRPVPRVLWARWAYGPRAAALLWPRARGRPRSGTFAELLFDTLVSGERIDTREYPKSPNYVGNAARRLARRYGWNLRRPAPFIYQLEDSP